MSEIAGQQAAHEREPIGDGGLTGKRKETHGRSLEWHLLQWSSLVPG